MGSLPLLGPHTSVGLGCYVSWQVQARPMEAQAAWVHHHRLRRAPPRSLAAGPLALG